MSCGRVALIFEGDTVGLVVGRRQGRAKFSFRIGAKSSVRLREAREVMGEREREGPGTEISIGVDLRKTTGSVRVWASARETEGRKGTSIPAGTVLVPRVRVGQLRFTRLNRAHNSWANSSSVGG